MAEVDALPPDEKEAVTMHAFQWTPKMAVDAATPVEGLTEEVAAKILEHTHGVRNVIYVLCGDDAKRMNHAPKGNSKGVPASEQANTEDVFIPTFMSRNGLDGFYVTKRKIMEREELTCDYGEFDADKKRKLGEEGDQ